MNHFIKQFHTRAQETRLTDKERHATYQALMREMRADAPIPSPFMMLLTRGLVPVMVCVLMLSGTAYAAQGSLPGDVLYSVKVSAIEPLRSALAFSTEAQVALHSEIAQKRIQEAEELAQMGTLTKSTSAELAANFSEHARALTAVTRANVHVESATEATVETTAQTDVAVGGVPAAGPSGAAPMQMMLKSASVATTTEATTTSAQAFPREDAFAAIEHKIKKADEALSMGSTSEAHADFSAALEDIEALK